MRKTACQTRIMAEELLHRSLISCQNEDDLTRKILNFSKKKIKDLCTPKVSLSQLVRLINEESTSTFFQNFIESFLTVGNTVSSQFRPCGLKKLTPWDNTDRCEELRIQSSNSRLSRAGISHKYSSEAIS